MAAATDISITSYPLPYVGLNWIEVLVQFTLEIGTMSPNSADISTAAVPELLSTDIVIGFEQSVIIEVATYRLRIGTDGILDIITNNLTGEPIDVGPSTYRVLIRRLQLPE
jgi:glycopeptide antibiotics resistance protein